MSIRQDPHHTAFVVKWYGPKRMQGQLLIHKKSDRLHRAGIKHVKKPVQTWQMPHFRPVIQVTGGISHVFQGRFLLKRKKRYSADKR
jgi:hypothetical protein